MWRASRSKTRDSGFVLVCGRDKESRVSLVELCRWAGFQTVSMKSARGPDGNPLAIIYDADRNRQHRIRDLQRLSQGLPGARIVTLIEYPRHDEIRQALDAGSDHVLGKPYDIDDLLRLLLPTSAPFPTEPVKKSAS
jgi:CheY-like chemotaxis protein